jgi:hypothetical protein
MAKHLLQVPSNPVELSPLPKGNSCTYKCKVTDSEINTRVKR